MIINNDISKQKLPLKSINGRRCLTKCYSKGETYLHPILLTGVADRATNSCAIDPVHSKDPQYRRENDMIFADICKIEDNNIYQPPDELESMLSSFYFNPRDFLASIYGLHSFDQVIYWTLENDYLPFNTIKRVHNCSWKVFGNKIEELSTGVFEYYYDISKTYWLKDYVNIIQKNIHSISLQKNHRATTMKFMILSVTNFINTIFLLVLLKDIFTNFRINGNPSNHIMIISKNIYSIN